MSCYLKKYFVMAIALAITNSFGICEVNAQVAKKVSMDIVFNSALHPAGTKLRLYREWPKRSLIDTGIVDSQHQYVLHVTDDFPAVFTLETRKPYLNQTIILEKGTCTVSLGADSQIVVKGGTLQNSLEQYTKQMKPLEKQWAAAGNKYMKAANLEEKLAAENENKVLAEKVQSQRIAFIKSNVNNSLGQWIAYHNLNLWQLKDLRTLKNYFLPGRATNYVSDGIENRLQALERQLLVGKKAPSFTLTSINGDPVSLDQLIKKNKYILVDFWASWCTPCRATNRNIAPLYADLKRKGIEVVSISVDENKELWKKAVQSDQIPWPQLISASMKSEAVLNYNVQSLPSTFLIDKDGVIVKQGVEIDELKKLL